VPKDFIPGKPAGSKSVYSMQADRSMAESASTTLPVTSQVAVGLAEADFDQLMRQHQRRVYRLLLGMVRDPEAADTLTQECFLRAWRKRATFRGEASVGTWLVRIAVNLARDHARNRRLAFWRRLFAAPAGDTRSQAELLPSPQSSPEQALVARQELDAVWSVVEALPQQQRAVFLLRFVEEMSLEEIAQALGLRVGSVKSHLFRALSAVRTQVGGKPGR
jgi:RNA polymerase sigma-70 factor (ECF subfamily)